MNQTNRVISLLLAFVVATIGQPQISQIIPEGTKVKVRLEQQLSSSTADEGQIVQFTVVDDVIVNEQTVIPQGANVSGTVVQAVPKRRMGRTGKLDFSIDKITAGDGGSIPVRYSLMKKEGGNTSVSTGLITAGVAVLFWPAAPFVLLRKGKDTTFQKGMVYEVFTDSNYTLKTKQAAILPGAILPVAELPTAVTITSSITGADIGVDGAFFGNTPSTILLVRGDHVIHVSKEGKSWQKTLRVTSGSTPSVNAILENNSTGHSNGEITLDSAKLAAKQNAPATPMAPMPTAEGPKPTNDSLNKASTQLPTESPKPVDRVVKPELRITSEPSGAEIEVDGQFMGNTPTTLVLSDGRVVVKVKKSGFQPWERTLTMNPGDKRTLNAEMENFGVIKLPK
jgi:hypothetical protein